MAEPVTKAVPVFRLCNPLDKESEETTGAMLKYLFPKDVANYVVDFIPPTPLDKRFLVSSNELDIDILELVSNKNTL